MYSENPEPPNEIREVHTSSGPKWIAFVFGGLLIAALAGLWYQSNEVGKVRQDLASTQQKLDQMQSQVQSSMTLAKNEVNESIAAMNKQLEDSSKAALKSVNQAQNTTKKQFNQALTKLNQKDEEITTQLGELKESSEQANTKVNESINGVKGEVSDVKNDVATTKTNLDNTITDLKRVTGDMGVMSGLIATNGKELEALKKLGERDYFEFTLPKSGGAKRVGDVQLTLKKSDPKRNKFTMEVLADDKRVEKRDRNVNEPVQFYAAGARFPYEIVVNEIRADQVIGYLSVPKVKALRASN